ncbi:hypothetical protein AHF37_05861 [Paragonimus kellicotti]|nr:hypothetical protein AHF37_05861 [Paragonimus kellicotti]
MQFIGSRNPSPSLLKNTVSALPLICRVIMTIHCAKLKGLNLNTKIKEIKAFFSPIPLKNTNFSKMVDHIHNYGTALVYFRQESDLKHALCKQGQLHGKNVRISLCAEKPTVNTTGKGAAEDTLSNKPTWPTRTAEQLKSDIRESGRLFVRNLSYQCTEEDLEKLFSAHGALSDIHLAYDIKKQTSKGFAFVTFLFPNEAVAAFEKLDKTDFMGRLLHILPAAEPLDSQSAITSNDGGRTKTEQNRDSAVMHKSDFQTTRHKELKASATVGHNWNALFIRPDAVATYLAAKYGLTKEQILNPTAHGSSLAVRLAHGETQLVTELREFLQKHGVDLTAFDATDAQSSTGTVASLGDGCGRRDRLESKAGATTRQVSGTAFLIKNLPVGTTEVEVRQLLQQHTKQLRDQSDPQSGTQRFRPKRVIVPPLGITAIVEFLLPQQARLVYRSLAYEPVSLRYFFCFCMG